MRGRSTLLFSSFALSLALVACGGSNDSTADDDASPDSATTNGGDSGGASSFDATASDTGASPDSTTTMGMEDSGSNASETGTDTGSTTDAGGATDTGATDAGSSATDAADAEITDAADAGQAPDADAAAPTDAGVDSGQELFTTLGPSASPIAVTINQGTAIGQGELNGATPSTLYNVAQDSNNKQTITPIDGGFAATGTVPDTAAGFCDYPTDGGAPTRLSYVTGATFETSPDGGDPMREMAPFYFPLVYTTTLTGPTGNAFGGEPPIIGLFDWRPKDIDEAIVVAESDDYGQTWYFMQTVLELNPDYTNTISGGYSATATSTGCPATITDTNANTTSLSGSQADDGWGHATVLQLPGVAAGTGQFLYMLDRNTNDLPDGGDRSLTTRRSTSSTSRTRRASSRSGTRTRRTTTSSRSRAPSRTRPARRRP